LNQTRAALGSSVRVTISETWYYGVLEDCPQHAERSAGCAGATASDATAFAFARLGRLGRGLASRNIGLHLLDILDLQLLHRLCAQQWPDMSIDAIAVGGEGAGFNWPPLSRQESGGGRRGWSPGTASNV
jgi:hypothetical protein